VKVNEQCKIVSLPQVVDTDFEMEQAYIAIVFGLNFDYGIETFFAVLMLTEIDGLLPSL
jgi:hypothetical protein